MDFNLKVVSNTGHLMTDLGIPSERCVELCGLVDEEIQKDREAGVATVMSRVGKHAKTLEEFALLQEIVGEHVQSEPPSLDSLINSILRGRPMTEQDLS